VLVADCAWVKDLVAPLVGALSAACAPGGLVLLAHQPRCTLVDERLFDLLLRRFELEAAPAAAGEPARGAIVIYRLRPLRGPRETGGES
jgi:hypothetical protein